MDNSVLFVMVFLAVVFLVILASPEEDEDDEEDDPPRTRWVRRNRVYRTFRTKPPDDQRD